MLITVLAPELLIAKGWDDLTGAWCTHGKLRQLAQEDGIPWTMTHTLLASMGGFVIRSQQDKRTESGLKGNDAKPSLPNPCRITAMDIFILRQSDHLMKLPQITE